MLNRKQYLLIKLAEEAAEVAQIALKTAQFGIFETSPTHPDDNATRCHAEIDDMMAIVAMLNDEFEFNYNGSYLAQRAKKEKVNHYYKYCVQIGEAE